MASKQIEFLKANGQRVEAGWRLFSRAMFPNGAPPQSSEMRKAFYAGAITVWNEITDLENSTDDMIDSDLERLDEIDKELGAAAYEIINSELKPQGTKAAQ